MVAIYKNNKENRGKKQSKKKVQKEKIYNKRYRKYKEKVRLKDTNPEREIQNKHNNND